MRVFATLILILCGLCAVASPAVPVDTVSKNGFWQRVNDYFSLDADSVGERSKRMRISFLGGPSYASDSKFSLGLAGVAQYRLNGCDTIQPSTATITANATTAGFWKLGIEATTFFPGERMRLNCEMNVEYAPRQFWGIGYAQGNDDLGKARLHEHDYKIKGELLFKLAPGLYAGPMLQWDYASSGATDRPELFEGQDHVVRNYGVGMTVQYDSRDLISNAFSGVYVYLNQVFRPRFMFNHYAFSTTDFRACYYRKAWKGAVIAGEVRALFNLGNPSWAMMALLGDSHTMRGYYHGRYRDKYSVTGQVEIRQRVYRRFGLTAWGGAGSVFHDARSLGDWLPNYGVGLRWEFRRRVNVRFDYGFGKSGQSGFLFNINEAF